MKNTSWKSISTTLPSTIVNESNTSVKTFDQKFNQLIKRHLSYLKKWSILNLSVSIPALGFFNNWLWYFFLMNISWGVINYLIAYLLFLHTAPFPSNHSNIVHRLGVYWHVKSMLLLNIGLDTAYIFAGLYLKNLMYHPEIAYPELYYGFGISVIFQGIFLFLHDNIFHYNHFITFRRYLYK
jgi:hypothetical protein